MHRLALYSAVIGSVVAVGAIAEAQPKGLLAVPAQRNHEGFFIRMTAGVGGASSTETAGGSEASGAGLFVSLAIGGALRPGLILCAESIGIHTVNPEIDRNHRSEGPDAAYAVEYLGGGVSWYSGSNLYLHGGLGLMQADVEPASDDDGLTGVGFTGSLGKEWWLNDTWGFGVAGTVLLGTADGTSSNTNTAVIGLVLSSTNN